MSGLICSVGELIDAFNDRINDVTDFTTSANHLNFIKL